MRLLIWFTVFMTMLAPCSSLASISIFPVEGKPSLRQNDENKLEFVVPSKFYEEITSSKDHKPLHYPVHFRLKFNDVNQHTFVGVSVKGIGSAYHNISGDLMIQNDEVLSRHKNFIGAAEFNDEDYFTIGPEGSGKAIDLVLKN